MWRRVPRILPPADAPGRTGRALDRPVHVRPPGPGRLPERRRPPTHGGQDQRRRQRQRRRRSDRCAAAAALARAPPPRICAGAFSAPPLRGGAPILGGVDSVRALLASARTGRSSRSLSTRGGGGGGGGGGGRDDDDGGSRGGGFKLDALPFSVSPDDALDSFRRWAHDEQGLRYLMGRTSVSIGAAYAPVWSFDVNVRFATASPGGGGGGGGGVRRRYDAKPGVFASAYPGSDACRVPGLSAYAGHAFRRSLIDPVHNTSLVFLGDRTVPFGSWMLRDMRTADGRAVGVFPDPWNATRGRALAVVAEELERLAEDDADRIGPCEVEIETLSSRRVYMPTFVIDYRVMGGEYRAFVSGCDAASGVSGVDHRALPYLSDTVRGYSSSFLNQFRKVARVGASMGTGTLIVAVRFLLNAAVRVLSRFHIIGAIGAGFVAFSKIVRPWMDNRSASAEWERQRENEAHMRDSWDREDDFVDGGGAGRYFRRNRERILRRLSGEHAHEEGDYDWYKEWEEWARQQWERQKNVHEQQAREQQRRRRTYAGREEQSYERQRWEEQQGRAGRDEQQAKTHKKAKEFVWDFDPNDPYSVLGVKRGATEQEVSAAFRREMLKHHPDTQGSAATQAERERALERSKLITNAYRKIKAQMK